MDMQQCPVFGYLMLDGFLSSLFPFANDLYRCGTLNWH